MEKTILANKAYWTGRAAGYSLVNRQELGSGQREKWKDCLRQEIERRFPGRPYEGLQALDVGTGPGFFAILLCELGCDVTAIDMTPAMLREAEGNAGALAERIHFMQMDAEELAYPEERFDLVVSRNLTWNLPHPAKAYAEWERVLRPGGLLLNFDANWYTYLFDGEAREAFEQDRLNSARMGIGDQNVGEGFDVMEDIARKMPLSDLSRPAWDLGLLSSLGFCCEADRQVWRRVWSEEEKLNFASTPLFLVRARKPASSRSGCDHVGSFPELPPFEE